MSEAIDMSKMDIHKHGIAVRSGGVLFLHLGNGGGTGGQLTANILKLIGALPSDIQKRVKYIGVDGDEFEPKNIGRQMCIPADMGKNKAEVIVGRYSRAFGVPAESAQFIDSFITEKNQLLEIMAENYNRTIVFIDSVDKNLPRKLIHETIAASTVNNPYTPIYSISCGNGEWTGQVVFGAKVTRQAHPLVSDVKAGINILSKPYIFNIPTAFELFPELIDLEADKQEEAMSCADRAVLNAQNLIANNMGSTLALNYVAAILQETKATFEVLKQPSVDLKKYEFVAPQTIGCCRYNALINYVENSQLTTDYLVNKKVGD